MFAVGDTPLAYAIRGGTVDTVQYLLDHDANPDKPIGKGSTPLHLAAAGGLILCNLSLSFMCMSLNSLFMCLE
jgi:hypothetical protein